MSRTIPSLGRQCTDADHCVYIQDDPVHHWCSAAKMTPVHGGTSEGKKNKALSSSLQKLKRFQDSLSYRILRHMHETLNIDENKN